VAASPSSAWSPLRHALFRNVWLATVVSNVGTWMQDVGAGWLMTSLAPAPMMVALVQTATTLPVMLLVLPAGAIADIVDRRRYLIIVQCWMLVVSATLGVLTFAQITNAWTLLAFTFALGIGLALMMPAWSSIVPELIPRNELQAAIALNSVGVNVSRAIGPALAGLIVAAMGSWLVFLLNAVSYIGVIGVLVTWRREPSKSSLPAERFVSAMRAGMRFVWHAPALQTVLIRGCAFFVFASATWSLFPLIVRRELERGPEVYGALLACIGIGAVSGALFLPRLRSLWSRDHLVAGATLLYACAALMLAYVHDVYVLAIAMLATGAGWITVLSSLQVSAQTALPAWVRARGLAAYMIVFMGGMAAGSLLWGHIATLAGIPAALTAAAVGAVLGVVATWKYRVGAQEAVDLAPSMHWPAPLVAEEPDRERGPVMVTIEYKIDPTRSAEFVELMQEMRGIRQRDGAFFWELFKDAADPARFFECFMDESWLEHLRQHERVSVADREVQARVQAFHLGDEPPRISHLLAQRIDETHEAIRTDV
jgi:MFS family permease/quinol monooxygenase YgiN